MTNTKIVAIRFVKAARFENVKNYKIKFGRKIISSIYAIIILLF